MISMDRMRGLLVEPGHLREDDFEETVRESEAQGRSLEEVVVEKGFILDDQLGQLLAAELQVPFVRVEHHQIDREVLNMIPESVARSKQVVAFGKDERGVHVGFVDPTDMETVSLIGKRVGTHVVAYLITRPDLQRALTQYQANLPETFAALWREIEEGNREVKEQGIVKVVDMILAYGYRAGASDIHIEPHTKRLIVRFRIDGVMHQVLEMPVELGESVVSRLKIMARIRTDEHQAAQDGKFRVEIDEEDLDVRLSVVPVTKGANVVMRLLASRLRQFTLSNLGMSDQDMKIIDRIIQNPHGMILVSGPTGSGKTTSVYAMMRVLDSPEVHIASIEDPVEYDVEGISQIQVNPDTNLTFAEGLRAIVRQDPDIIVVGEVRDHQTADIAINSAMTGHLVLSTMHANDAATTLVRLVEMGLEAFLVASTVKVVIAQRLVREICTVCRYSFTLEDELKKGEEWSELLDVKLKSWLSAADYKKMRSSLLYRGRGCTACNNTGYAGRIGIFEILEVDDTIRGLITKNATSDEIVKAVLKAGGRLMVDDGMEKASLGVTTMEEVLRWVH